jgi:hypothetical protein
MYPYKHLLPGLVFFLLFANPFAAVTAESSFKKLSNEQLLAKTRLYKCTEAELDRLLPELHRRFPNHLKRLKAVAVMYKGAPYYTGPLTDETADWMPYAKADCTMFVLYATAFAGSRSCEEARRHMQHLHYRRGAVGFKTRYHFTSDRITDPDNRYFSVITKKHLKDPSSLRHVTLALNRKQDGSCFFNGRLDSWSRRVTLSYIPQTGFHPAMLKNLPEAVGVALVKKSNWGKGIIVGHEGLLIEGDLYHASPSSGVVVIKDFLTAGFPQSKWEGLILFSINEVPTIYSGDTD